MNKKELVNAVAESQGITGAQAEKIIQSFMDSISKTLKKDGNVKLVGFGTFSTVKRLTRTGRNPLTGAEIKIPAKKIVKFKAGSKLSGSI